MKPSPTISVVIPWQAGCEYRARALAYVLAWWERHHPHAEVLVGEPAPPGSVWCKARAVRHAIDRAAGRTIAISDADVVLADPAALSAALEALEDGAGWAVPHNLVHRLGATTTERITAGKIDGPDGQAMAQAPYVGWLGGGMLVLPRDSYEIAPFDPRFEGWGQEDEAIAVEMTTMLGPPWRGDADLWHLWHPTPRRRDRRVGSTANSLLLARYHAASESRASMADLIAEGVAA